MPGPTIPRERLDLAKRLFLAGKSSHAIARQLCAEYHVTARTARRYIALTEAKLAALPKSPPEAAPVRSAQMPASVGPKAGASSLSTVEATPTTVTIVSLTTNATGATYTAFGSTAATVAVQPMMTKQRAQDSHDEGNLLLVLKD